MERVIAMPGPVPDDVRVEALYWAAAFANLQDDPARATELAGEALELARAGGNRLGEAMALTELGEATTATDLRQGRSLVEAALPIFRVLHDEIREGMALGQLGRFAHRQQKLAQAAAFHHAALGIWRELDHPWGIPSALRDQASAALAQGDLGLSWALHGESLDR